MRRFIAGNLQLRMDIEKRFGGDAPGVTSAAVSLSIGDVGPLREWLQLPVAIAPLWFPEEEIHQAELPWAPRLLLVGVVADFRTLTLPGLGPGWRNGLLCIPLPKDELNAAVNAQYGRDEIKELHLIVFLRSESAGMQKASRCREK